MEIFLYVKECLNKFNYPNIQALNDHEIAEIFSSGNRTFLVSWIFKNLDSDYISLINNFTKEEVAELIYQHGFCSNKDKMKFMNGELTSSDQFDILYKMFKYLQSITETNQLDKDREPVCMDEFQILKSIDTNLFSVYGPKKSLNFAEREAKIREYYDEINRLKVLIGSEDSTKIKDYTVLPNNLETRLEDALKNFNMNMPQFRRGVLEIMGRRNKLEERKNVEFNSESANTLEVCKKDAELVVEFIKNLNLVTGLRTNNDNFPDVISTKKEKSMLCEVSKLCSEVSSAL